MAGASRWEVRGMVLFLACFAPPASHPSPLSAQDWNSAATRELVRRAVARRLSVQADSALRSYQARAHGFVFFLAQIGEGLTEPPRLVKADELVVEVYWRAPDESKQIIQGWRDGNFLPTDIHYHRDHLGIVTNDFGNVIRIGEGDEVRDVPHPLSPAGLAVYDFALADSAAIRTATGRVTVYQLQVKPKSFARPLVVGMLYLDVTQAELVRFRFSFTPAAYLDRQLEDITVVLENGLHENRFWLPRRQEIEIRRRATWLDFPARGIIRGRWEIDEYELNPELPRELFTRPAIGGLLRPGAGTGWEESLEEAIAGVARPVRRQDMEALRGEVERIAGSRVLSGLPSRRLATGSLSDIIRVNRVQGLTLGVGATFGLPESRLRVRPSLAFGTSDERLLGSVLASWSSGRTQFDLTASRRIGDFSDLPVIAPLLNSVTAQEAGEDYGDYVLLNAIDFGIRRRMGGRTTLLAGLGLEESRSVFTHASPASGRHRSNPPLGTGTYRMVRAGLERASGGIAVDRDLQGRLALEAGEGPESYLRVTAEARWLHGLGGSDLLSRIYFGVGTPHLPPHRSFVLGGRGTLVGVPFRAYGGRLAGLAHLEWRFEAPVPSIPLGSFASTGRSVTLAPFIAMGFAARPVAGLPWDRSDGLSPVVGLGLEWFMRLIRVDAGVGLRDGTFGLTVDINRDWWGLL